MVNIDLLLKQEVRNGQNLVKPAFIPGLRSVVQPIDMHLQQTGITCVEFVDALAAEDHVGVRFRQTLLKRHVALHRRHAIHQTMTVVEAQQRLIQMNHIHADHFNNLAQVFHQHILPNRTGLIDLCKGVILPIGSVALNHLFQRCTVQHGLVFQPIGNIIRIVQVRAQHVGMHADLESQLMGVIHAILQAGAHRIIGIIHVVIRRAPIHQMEQRFFRIDQLRQFRYQLLIHHVHQANQLNVLRPIRLGSNDLFQPEGFVHVVLVNLCALLPCPLIGNETPFHRFKGLVLRKGCLRNRLNGDIEVIFIRRNIQRLELAAAVIRVDEQTARRRLNQQHLRLPVVRISHAAHVRHGVATGQENAVPRRNNHLIVQRHFQCETDGRNAILLHLGFLTKHHFAVCFHAQPGLKRVAVLPALRDSGRRSKVRLHVGRGHRFVSGCIPETRVAEIHPDLPVAECQRAIFLLQRHAFASANLPIAGVQPQIRCLCACTGQRQQANQCQQCPHFPQPHAPPQMMIFTD